MGVSRVVEAEDLVPGGRVLAAAEASGGAFARVAALRVVADVPPGHYRYTAVARLPEPGRVSLTSNGEQIGGWTVGPEWQEIAGVVFVSDPSDQLGIQFSDGYDARAHLDVDVLRLVATDPSFTTVGTSIRDLDGGRVSVRGVNRTGYQRWVDGAPHFNRSRHESEPMASWGFNAVRLQLNQEFWLNSCTVDSSWVHASRRKPDGSPYRYRELIAEEVRRFTGAGFLVVLDLHMTSRGRNTGCVTDAHLKEMPDLRSVGFWRTVADTFKSNPNVAFDLFNEPQFVDAHDPPDDPDRVWRHGGTVAYRDGVRTPSYTAVGMQKLYDVIRDDAGAHNLIFVSGLRYALDVGVLLRAPLDGFGIVAAPHVYCEGCEPAGPNAGHERMIFGDQPGGPDGVGTADVYPVVVTEWGSAEYWNSTPNAATVDWLERRDLGWMAYAWAEGGDSRGTSRWGIYSGDNRAPNAAGRPIRKALR